MSLKEEVVRVMVLGGEEGGGGWEWQGVIKGLRVASMEREGRGWNRQKGRGVKQWNEGDMAWMGRVDKDTIR